MAQNEGPGMKIENRTPRFGQALSALLVVSWLIAVAVVWLRGAPNEPARHSTWLILAAVGIGAVAALVHANRRPAVTFDIGRNGDVVLTEATLFRRRSRQNRSEEVVDIAVYESEDQDGDPYFRAVVTFMDGGQSVIAEGHCRYEIEQTIARVGDALQTARDGAAG